MSRSAPTPAFIFCLAALSLAGCGPRAATVEEYNTRLVVFPNGHKIRAELAVSAEEMLRGMKYRDSLDENRGMLFLHNKAGKYPYWMYEVKVPLDLLWLDRDRKIVQLIHQAPPCPGPPEKCLSYGGAFEALYVLELKAGTAKKHNLKPGMTLDF
jgi:uncharacterized membrane protein (UPF0127 family)